MSLCSLVVWRPRTALLTAVTLGVTVFPPRVFPLDIGGVRTDVVEILLLTLVGLALLARDRVRLPFRGPLLLVVGSFLVGAAIAIHNGADLSGVLGPLKLGFLYLTPFVVAACFPADSGKAALEAWIIRVATVGTVYVLVTTAVGASYNAAESQPVYTLGVANSTPRLRPALLALVVVATLLLVARIANSGGTTVEVLQVALFMVLVLLSYNRSTIVPLVAAVVVTAVLHTGPRRPRRLVWNVLLAGSMLLVLTLAASHGALGEAGRAVVARVESVTNPAHRDDPTYLDREDENTSARRVLATNPVFGVGLAQPYGAARLLYFPHPPRLQTVQRTFIHNTFFGIWLQLGLLGLLAFTWLAACVWRAARWARTSLSPEAAGRCVAGAAGAAAFAFSGVFQPVLLHRPSILAFALCLFFAYPSSPVESDV
jgi:hypothetical protein